MLKFITFCVPDFFCFGHLLFILFSYMVYNFEVKAKAVYMYAGNKSSRKTAKEMGCSKSIVCKWAKDADKCMLGIQKSKKGYNYKITNHILEFIKKEISKCSYLRLKDIQQIGMSRTHR